MAIDRAKLLPRSSRTTTQKMDSARKNATRENSIMIPLSIPKASGKDIVLKYSILGGASGGSATKGIDYNFGAISDISKNDDLDSIVTILKGSTIANIQLSIIDDTFNEEDQTVIITASLANSYPDDPTNIYYNSIGTESGAEASLGPVSNTHLTLQTICSV